MQVVTIDADPTGALSRWAERAYEGPPFESVAEADETRLAHLIAAKADEADLVLVDTAGFGNRAATVAMTSADAVLVPSLEHFHADWKSRSDVRSMKLLAKFELECFQSG